MFKGRVLLFISCIMICALALAMGVSAEEVKGESFELTLLHEGEFPTDKYFSDTLYEESEVIREALFSRKSEIEIEKSVDAYEIANLYEWVVNSEPELFYVEGIVKIADNGSKYIIYPQYEEKALLFAYDSGADFQAEVNRILSYIEDDMSTVEKALAVHDYFARFYEYDYTYRNSDIGQIFLEKKGVCQAYADGFTYIMQKKLGIECYTLASNALNHAWNVIKIDGEWYHIDVTHDDPRFNGKDHFGNARHLHFLVSSDTIRKDPKHNSYDWVVSGYRKWEYGFETPSKVVEPTSKRFENYVWATSGYTPFIYYEGKWYYTYLGYLYTYDVNKNESTEVMELDYYYSSNYDTFEIYEDTVFFKYYWSEDRWGEYMTYMYPMKGSGNRLLSALNGVYSFRRNGDKLEYISYESGYGVEYELDLTKLEYKVKTPTITIDKEYCEAYFECDTEGVEFYYTLDGTDPTIESDSWDFILYDETDCFELKVIAAKEGFNNSDAASVIINDVPRITYLTSWKENGKTMLEVNVERAPENAVVYVAAYDRNDVVLEFKKLLISDGVAEGEFDAKNVWMYKVLMWAENSMTPLAPSKEY